MSIDSQEFFTWIFLVPLPSAFETWPSASYLFIFLAAHVREIRPSITYLWPSGLFSSPLSTELTASSSSHQYDPKYA